MKIRNINKTVHSVYKSQSKPMKFQALKRGGSRVN